MFKPKVDRISYGGAIIGKEEKDAINAVIDSQGGRRWTIGPESVAFEKELAENTGVKRAVVVNSGSSALLIAIASLKLPKGSLVIIPAVNFPTAFNSILQNGLVPLVVDVDPKTFLLSLDEVEKALLMHKVSAVVAVNVAGNTIDLIKLRNLIGKETKIILDDCDGYSTLLNGAYVEKFADVSCVSFHAAHIISMGEGGAVLTDDNQMADTCTKLREWGRASGTDKIYKYPGFPDDYKERYVYEEIGYNLKPLELQCAMGRVQLKRLASFKKARQENFKKIEKLFYMSGAFRSVEYLDNADICWFSFPFITEIPRIRVMDTLEKNNIECRTIFSGNITKHPAYKNSNYEIFGSLENADMVMEKGVFISVHPSITDEMIKFIWEVMGTL